MSVAGPSRRPPSCRRRKRLRPGVGWWGSPVRFIVDQGCGYPFLFGFVSLWFSGVWETLIFGTGDWFAFGEPIFCGLFTPTNPLPGHRLVPESQYIYIYTQTYVSCSSFEHKYDGKSDGLARHEMHRHPTGACQKKVVGHIPSSESHGVQANEATATCFPSDS